MENLKAMCLTQLEGFVSKKNVEYSMQAKEVHLWTQANFQELEYLF